MKFTRRDFFKSLAASALAAGAALPVGFPKEDQWPWPSQYNALRYLPIKGPDGRVVNLLIAPPEFDQSLTLA